MRCAVKTALPGTVLQRATRLFGSLVLCCGLTVGAQAQETRISRDDARSAALQLLAVRQPQQALVLADGLLSVDPKDVTALLVRARALSDLGRTKSAKDAAAQAWTAADGDREKYFAALVQAQTLVQNDRRGIAQYWLRRAAQIAPDERMKSTAIRQFQSVRSETPWRLRLNFFAAPSDNLNQAPKVTAIQANGIDGVRGGARSGFRYGADASLRYSFNLAERSRLHVTGMGLVSRVTFTDSAAEKNSSLKVGDLSYDNLGLSLAYETIGASRQWKAQAEVSVKRDWFGGMHFSDTSAVRLSYDRALSPRLKAGMRLGAVREARFDKSIRDNDTTQVGGYLAWSLATHGTLRLDLDVETTTSESSVTARQTQKSRLSYAFAKPLGPVLPRLSLTHSTYDYAQGGVYGDAARKDEQWGLSVDMLLPDYSLFGFAPEIGVTYTDRSSNYEQLFGTARTDIRLGIKSVF